MLRDYQIRAVENVRAEFARGILRTCLTAPCGAGKTRIMRFMTEQAVKLGNRSLFLVHRRELLIQASREIPGCGVIAPGYAMTDSMIQVASVQTLARRIGDVIPPQLLVLDECHHATARTWTDVIAAFPEAFVVGLTATPARLGGQGLGDVFESLVMGPTARELIDVGYLAPYRYYAPPMVADMSGVKTVRGDFDGAETAIRVDKPAVVGDAVEHYRRLAAGKRAIAYCASRSHSRHVAEAFNAAGIPARHVDGETPAAEREQAIADFKSGRLTVLANVDLFGEGLDCPGMEAVILLRPTQSLTLFIQQSMRAMRPDRANPFKRSIILDHVGNAFRHGLPDDDREWSLEGRKRSRGEQSTVAIKRCEGCFSVHSPAPVCPYCGYVYKIAPRELRQQAGELQELTAVERKDRRCEVGLARTVADLERIAKERNYSREWVWHQKRLKGIK